MGGVLVSAVPKEGEGYRSDLRDAKWAELSPDTDMPIITAPTTISRTG
jgi:hypothetical protein